jgi:hypothetical protein
MASSKELTPVLSLTTNFLNKAHIPKTNIRKARVNTLMASPASRTTALPTLMHRLKATEA